MACGLHRLGHGRPLGRPERGQRMNGECSFYTTSGMIQRHVSANALLDHYNENGRVYELREHPEGYREMWHKGQNRKIGEFRAE